MTRRDKERNRRHLQKWLIFLPLAERYLLRSGWIIWHESEDENKYINPRTHRVYVLDHALMSELWHRRVSKLSPEAKRAAIEAWFADFGPHKKRRRFP